MVANWKIAAASLLIFAAGVLTGALAVRATTPPAKSHAAVRVAHAGPSATGGTNATPAVARGGTNRIGNAPHAVQRLEAFRRAGRQLDLEPARRARIDALIGESTERLRTLWAPVAPLLQQEVRDLRKRIAEELTPEQRERFDALLDKRANAAATNTAAAGATVP